MAYELDQAIDLADVDGGRVTVRSPSGDFIINDPRGVVRASIRLIRDGQPIDEAFSEIPEGLRAEAADRVLGLLLDRRIIRASSGGSCSTAVQDADPLIGWLAHIGGQRLHSSHTCTIVGTGLLQRQLTSLLGDLEIGYSDGAGDLEQCRGASSIIACADTANHQLFLDMNKVAIEKDIPFLPVSVDRHVCAIGPMIIPRATACYECYYHRLRANRQIGATPQAAFENTSASLIAANIAAGLAVATLIRFLAGAAFDLHLASVVRHSVLDGRTGHTIALKLPRCPTCGPASLAHPLPPIRTIPEASSEAA